jgi:hypothetical protein
MQTRNSYIAKMKEELDKLEMQLDALEVSAKSMKEDAREQYNLELEKVRIQSRLAKEKMDTLISEWTESTEGSWDLLVLETEKIRDAFVHSFRYFKSQF